MLGFHCITPTIKKGGEGFIKESKQIDAGHSKNKQIDAGAT
jgi:hypothetical protein